MRELEAHAELSRKFGSDPQFVLLGGGNTSYKTDDTLYIKPSGVALADIGPEQFIAMDRGAVRQAFVEPVPEDCWKREAAVKERMAAAVRPPGAGRPSVEAPLHEVIAFTYVYHMHPAAVNGMTCAADGPRACRTLFPEALWIDYVDPGYTLACEVSERLRQRTDAGRKQPEVIFLQNHGVFVGANSLPRIEAIYADIMKTLATTYAEAGVATVLDDTPADESAVQAVAPALRTLLGTETARATVVSGPSFIPARGPLSPDHIVYSKSFVHEGEVCSQAMARFKTEHGYAPKLAVVPGKAAFAVDADLRNSRGVLAVARDAALVQQLSHAFGGPRFLGDRERGFIENWEVESYRRQVAAAGKRRRRAEGRICIVTGAAQGFGLGIARGLAEEGALVVVADLNREGADQAAAEIEAEHGAASALAVEVNIADEDSVARMVRNVVASCGGVDALVANAGVLRAGPVKTFEKGDWDLVTSVNYTGYFLCVKHVSRVMAAQAAVGPGPWADVIQINSKSGLEGSNRNAAYAGGKFGGIGLTQSFAKELVEDRIKVNSVCPGNFFDGPLWSAPETGLFSQYLRTGKVPGAKSVGDVRAAYEAKVPMGRGCTPADVLRAILYLMEQEYETGQALPVTGGQVMLH